MVTALFFILGLSVTAAIIVTIAGSEKRVSHNEYVHARSFYSSDAGTEVALNWLLMRQSPPRVIDQDGTVQALNDYTYLYTSGNTEPNKYKYDIDFDRVRFRPGWSREYLDFDYTIDSDGASTQQSETVIQVQASRLFRQGY
jgi:hypothetical protein